MKNIIKIIIKLKDMYPDAKCSLNFNTPYELLVAVILSAQCTDERINLITPKLFIKYPNVKSFANSNIEELEKLIYSCGFYKNKANNIKLNANKIIDKFSGEVPNNMEDLLTLPGVGRKSANVILTEVFKNSVGIAIDTHAIRISNRIGFSQNSNPDKIEKDLLKIIPKEYLKDINHLLIYHGRGLCTAKKPKCEICGIKNYCMFYAKLID